MRKNPLSPAHTQSTVKETDPFLEILADIDDAIPSAEHVESDEYLQIIFGESASDVGLDASSDASSLDANKSDINSSDTNSSDTSSSNHGLNYNLDTATQSISADASQPASAALINNQTGSDNQTGSSNQTNNNQTSNNQTSNNQASNNDQTGSVSEEADNADASAHPIYYLLTVWEVFGISLVCLLFVFWLKHVSIANYVQQSYQVTPFWQQWQQHGFWRAGAAVNHQFNRWFEPNDTQAPQIHSADNPVSTSDRQEDVISTYPAQLTELRPVDQTKAEQTKTDQTKVEQAAVEQIIAEQAKVEQVATTDAPIIKPNTVQLKPDQKVFFVGDSLMEGVAPRAMRLLRKRHGIKSINLSKQNTGLSYSHFFDWLEAVETTFSEQKDIGLMVVFIGANDPWDVPNPKKPWKYIRFGTKAWDALYIQKVNRMLDSAESRGASVIWMLMPAMKKKKLNQHIGYINRLYVQALQERARTTAKIIANKEEQASKEEQDVAKATQLNPNHDASEPTSPKAASGQFIVWSTQPLLSEMSTQLPSASEQKRDFLTGQDALSASSDTMDFANTAQVSGKTVKVRTSDGIHFTLKGQRVLAETLLEFIESDAS